MGDLIPMHGRNGDDDHKDHVNIPVELPEPGPDSDLPSVKLSVETPDGAVRELGPGQVGFIEGEPPEGENLNFECPNCGNVWWRAVITLSKDEHPTVTGFYPQLRCDSCGHDVAYLAGDSGP